MTDFFLGCDGGGTKTDLVVITGEGRLAGYLQFPSTYYLSSRSRGIEQIVSPERRWRRSQLVWCAVPMYRDWFAPPRQLNR